MLVDTLRGARANSQFTARPAGGALNPLGEPPEKQGEQRARETRVGEGGRRPSGSDGQSPTRVDVSLPRLCVKGPAWTFLFF